MTIVHTSFSFPVLIRFFFVLFYDPFPRLKHAYDTMTGTIGNANRNNGAMEKIVKKWHNRK